MAGAGKAAARPAAPVRLGIRANWRQFWLLVLLNAFVGGMVGLERTLVPLIGSEMFRLASSVAVTAFIVSFGLVKAVTNLLSGPLADGWGRKPTLVLGWVFGLPVPLLIMWAPSWGWIIAANALLGVNQGLTWSMTVNMKIDLVGPRWRGLAVGLNEFAGYVAVGATAFATGYIAAKSGLRPDPFYLGIGYAVLGLALSLFAVRDTGDHVRLEAATHARAEMPARFRDVFVATSLKNPDLFAISQAGLVTNLKDGLVWGLFPLFFAAFGLGVERIGVLKAVYPAVWGVLQLVSGPLSDRIGRKGLIVGGMAVQACGLFVAAAARSFAGWLPAAVLLGIGTAMVYPTLIAALSRAAHPAWRARALSVYRFWRDLGYAAGALCGGLMAALFGFAAAIAAVGALTLLSGLLVLGLMREPR